MSFKCYCRRMEFLYFDEERTNCYCGCAMLSPSIYIGVSLVVGHSKTFCWSMFLVFPTGLYDYPYLVYNFLDLESNHDYKTFHDCVFCFGIFENGGCDGKVATN